LRPEILRQALASAASLAGSCVSDCSRAVPLSQIVNNSGLADAGAALAGKSVLLAVDSQYEAALALIDLDGLARRIVLLPPDIGAQQLPAILRDAAVEAIVCSDAAQFRQFGLPAFRIDTALPARVETPRYPVLTEWLLLTSGTTGDPKLAIHTLATLTGAIAPRSGDAPRPVWATFYDIRRYGGLQIFLRAMLAGASLVLSEPDEPVAAQLQRFGDSGVTHISGTPTHWRRALMSQIPPSFAPRYIRLSGEIADQAVLDALKHAFPAAEIGHAYASTEAGVGFDVTDGLEGFPASYLEAPRNGVELRIADGSLQLRSARSARGYAGRPDLTLADADGWVESGDMVEQRGARIHFVGRRSGIINVGGLKVHPEEIEAVIGRHQAVRQTKVRARRSPLLGNIVVADVVLGVTAGDADSIKQSIAALCADRLPAHKVPAIINIVPAIEVTAGGKVARAHA
jgi:acyl-CoA synthetase (AMP-forming)/AMP-acid ligase II